MNGTIHIGDFFYLRNSVKDIDETDYKNVTPIVEAVQAFEQFTNLSIYIIDYFINISRNILKKLIVKGNEKNRIFIKYNIWLIGNCKTR